MSDSNDLTLGYMMGSSDNSSSGGGFGLGGDGWGGLLGLIVVASLFGWGGMGGGFGFGGFGGGAGLQGMATRADINEGFALNNITGGIQAIQQGICDSTYALTNAINGGFHDQTVATLQGFNGVQQAFCNLGHQLSDCCCQTQRAIDGVNYNLATQTNALQTAMCTNTRDLIDNQNANTRQIMDFLVQDKISALQAENQSLKFAASQDRQNALLTTAMTAQTNQIIGAINPAPIPSYSVPNPYTGYWGRYGGYGRGNDCGCNSGCGF